ncbi:hypothetical protein GGI25_003726 [Coemansia spiralis]|uniref:Uncharacterized protein n=1 Tax=Coemansia spiralis TaxID=417178 RepID=A0A9W8KW80_9FUNG|nr:hypothetical protein BX070DRAFT_253293 [Coemansia spiralis]KAJ2675992.1 hypothetical protein GGI25_003726 [Coemansia spiralis]
MPQSSANIAYTDFILQAMGHVTAISTMPFALTELYIYFWMSTTKTTIGNCDLISIYTDRSSSAVDGAPNMVFVAIIWCQWKDGHSNKFNLLARTKGGNVSSTIGESMALAPVARLI